MVQAVNSAGRSALYPLVIRSAGKATFTVVVPQFTWQAYNAYGGSSLYKLDPATGTNVRAVSFERPYSSQGGATFMYGHGGSNEISALRWIERNSINVNYVSDLDLARGRPITLPEKGLLFIGHSEYWTPDEYDFVERFRDAGGHLAFFGSNNAYWNIRLQPGAVVPDTGTIIWCAKSSNDPLARSTREITTRFRDNPLNRPENALYGVMYGGRLGVTRSDNYVGTVADSGVGQTTAGFLASAQLVSGEQIPVIVGAENDQIVANGRTPASLQVLFKSLVPASDGGKPVVSHATFFTASSGAGVFASGSNEWAQGLDGLFGTESPKLQALMRSILEWMTAH